MTRVCRPVDCRGRRRSHQGRRSQTAERRAGRDSWDLTRTAQGKAALIVTEAATNLVKHAGGGQLILQGSGISARPERFWKYWRLTRGEE